MKISWIEDSLNELQVKANIEVATPAKTNALDFLTYNSTWDNCPVINGVFLFNYFIFIFFWYVYV